jgi:hypothetical protein
MHQVTTRFPKQTHQVCDVIASASSFKIVSSGSNYVVGQGEIRCVDLRYHAMSQFASFVQSPPLKSKSLTSEIINSFFSI